MSRRARQACQHPGRMGTGTRPGHRVEGTGHKPILQWELKNLSGRKRESDPEARPRRGPREEVVL